MPTSRRPSPTPGLLAGLLITLAAVVVSGVYVTRQISGLRALQTDITDRHRRDSLQLLRIQNDLNSIGLAMRDMLDNDDGYPLTAWQATYGPALEVHDRLAGDGGQSRITVHLADGDVALFGGARASAFAYLARGGATCAARARGSR